MKFYIADVFAENKFEGNPLAVCLPDKEISQVEMQKIAREINFSETTFITSGLQENGGYDVRIFMPDAEIPFGGHPTLGTAYIIQHFLEDRPSDEVKLNLQIGQIPVAFKSENAWMTQNQPTFGEKVDAEKIARVLQINVEDVSLEFPPQVVSTGLASVIINLRTLEAVKRCQIDHFEYQTLLEQLGNVNIHVFTKETFDSNHDLHARVFMFSAGYLEDPATGSSTGNLAGYLLEHNFFKSSELNIRIEQGYLIGRPSLLMANARKNDEHFVIQVGGRVFIVAEGKWL